MPIPKVQLIADIIKTMKHGSKSVGTSIVQLTASDVPVSRGVLIKAASTNTGLVYVGNSDVTAFTTAATDGMELAAGEGVTVELDNANKVYVVSDTASQTVFWTGV